jgi:methyl-accepting chemotaxis protein
MDDMADMIGQAHGKQYFDKFRSQIATFVGREQKLLNERKASSSGDNAEASKWVEHTYEVIATAKNIEAAAVDMETGARGYFLAGKEGFLDPYNNGGTQFDELVVSLSKTVNDNPEQVSLLSQIKTNIDAWKSNVIEPTIALRRQIGDAQTMNDMAKLVGEARGKQYFDKFRNQIVTFIEREASLMGQRQDDAKSSASNAKATIGIGTTMAILIAMVISFIVARGIVNALNQIISSLTTGSEQVFSAAGQVSSASQSLAEGATEQAAGLEETSSSLEEMASMTKQNADNAQQANTLATDARKAADTGSSSMSKMNEAIEEIQKSSDETAKIIKVIDEIAFQTNLLALNAAVEAARAGEAGKGFAVVAEEVRNLAMRSAEAAKNTSEMIEESVKNAKNGVDIAAEVGKVLDEIVGSIGKTSDLVGEIAAASQEQSQGIDQVNTSVNQMDKVTQQNAANAEESASASEELSAQAEQMNGIVAQLSTMVGGRTDSISGKSQRKRSKSKQNSVESELGSSHHVFHQIANGPGSKSEKSPAKVGSQQHAIPLDDDNDGLKEFNG